MVLIFALCNIFEGHRKYSTLRHYPLQKSISNKVSRKTRSSTEEPLAYFANSDSYSRHEYVFTVFSDITKACDTIWISTVIKQLHTWNITGPMLRFTLNFLHNKRF